MYKMVRLVLNCSTYWSVAVIPAGNDCIKAETTKTLYLSTYSQEIKKSEELQIQNREEVGMELDDELSEDGAGNTAAYQSRPGEIDPTDSQVETQQKSVAQPDAKRARIDSGIKIVFCLHR